MKYLASTLIAASVCASAFAGEMVMDNKKIIDTPPPPALCNFKENEWSADIYGLVGVPTGSGAFIDSTYGGGGFGLNYFWSMYWGAGVETYLASGDQLMQGAFGNVFLRYPICSMNLAPYIIGSGGGIFPWDGGKGFGGGGAGLGIEYRPSDKFGIFTDARHMWLGDENKHVIARLGAKIVF